MENKIVSYNEKDKREARRMALDARFIESMRRLADKHNCKIINIDLANRVIEFDCPPETQNDCAQEMADIYEEYLVEDGNYPGAH